MKTILPCILLAAVAVAVSGCEKKAAPETAPTPAPTAPAEQPK